MRLAVCESVRGISSCCWYPNVGADNSGVAAVPVDWVGGGCNQTSVVPSPLLTIYL